MLSFRLTSITVSTVLMASALRVELDSSWSGQSSPNGWDSITNTAITTVDDCTNKADREYVNYEKTDGNGGTKNAYAMCKAGKPYIGIYCSAGISFGGTAIKAQ